MVIGLILNRKSSYSRRMGAGEPVNFQVIDNLGSYMLAVIIDATALYSRRIALVASNFQPLLAFGHCNAFCNVQFYTCRFVTSLVSQILVSPTHTFNFMNP